MELSQGVYSTYSPQQTKSANPAGQAGLCGRSIEVCFVASVKHVVILNKNKKQSSVYIALEAP